VNFLGTTDNQALELKVNGARAYRLQPGTDSPNVIGGYSGNSVGAGVSGATITGGGSNAGSNSIGDVNSAFAVIRLLVAGRQTPLH
jgi:hypothetical protein